MRSRGQLWQWSMQSLTILTPAMTGVMISSDATFVVIRHSKSAVGARLNMARQNASDGDQSARTPVALNHVPVHVTVVNGTKTWYSQQLAWINPRPFPLDHILINQFLNKCFYKRYELLKRREMNWMEMNAGICEGPKFGSFLYVPLFVINAGNGK